MPIQIGYLARLSNHDDEAAERIFHANTDVNFYDAPGLVNQVSSDLEFQVRSIIELLDKIREFHGLSGPEAPLRIAVEVVDARSDKSQALPALPSETEVR
jgi:hypothetical protein